MRDLSFGMWDPGPWPGIEPRQPRHWEGRVLVTGTPGSPQSHILLDEWIDRCACIYIHIHMLLLISHWVGLFSSITQSCPTLCDPTESSLPGLPVQPTPRVYSKLMSIESVMPSNHLILCRPPLLIPSIFPRTRVFSSKSVLHIRRPKYWSFSLSISPSSEHPGLISFGWTSWISLQSKALSRVFSNTTVQKHQFFGAQLSLVLLPGKSHGRRSLVGYGPWGR